MNNRSSLSSCYLETKQEYYLRTSDETPFVNYRQSDHDLDLDFVPDHVHVDRNDRNILRKVNLDFLKILRDKCLFEKNGNHYIFRPFTLSTITDVVNYIEDRYYKGVNSGNNTFSDSDLHDDIFDYFQISIYL